MKIYVSGTFTAQKRLREQAERLFHLGHEITSTWLTEVAKPDHLSEDEWLFRLATKDVAEVFASDCIIMDIEGKSTSGGRYTEWGVASHPRDAKLRYIVGPMERGCFQRLADRHFETWDELIAFLAPHAKQGAHNPGDFPVDHQPSKGSLIHGGEPYEHPLGYRKGAE